MLYSKNISAEQLVNSSSTGTVRVLLAVAALIAITLSFI